MSRDTVEDGGSQGGSEVTSLWYKLTNFSKSDLSFNQGTPSIPSSCSHFLHKPSFFSASWHLMVAGPSALTVGQTVTHSWGFP